MAEINITFWVIKRTDTFTYLKSTINQIIGSCGTRFFFSFKHLDLFNICKFAKTYFTSVDLTTRSDGGFFKKLK